MNAWKLESGAWVPCLSVQIGDRGFRYGMSVFETVAVHNGRPVLVEEHLERLGRAADSAGWAGAGLPVALPEFLKGTDGVLRIYATAGEGRPGDPFCGSVYGIFEECEVGTDFSDVRAACSYAPYLPRPGGWKTGNYWQNVDAIFSARDMGVDDVLLFNPAGCLVCASMGNIFLELDGTWKTPALGAGARDGVVRGWVTKQIPVEETLLGPDDVAVCTGCFLTNSRVGVRGVSELDGRALSTDISGLRNLYRADVL